MSYQNELDDFYRFSPFRLVDVVKKEEGGGVCELCRNRRLKSLCVVVDRMGRSWHIGRECWSNIEERQFTDPACSLRQFAIRA